MKPIVTASSLFLFLAYSWFIVMEFVLRHHNFMLRATVAALIVFYAVLTLIHMRTASDELVQILTVASLTGITLGFFGLLAALRQIHFEGYLFVLALSLLVQSCFTLAGILARPRLHTA